MFREIRAAIATKDWRGEATDEAAVSITAIVADDLEMHVSRETIYQSLFVQGRGALRQELARDLRSGQRSAVHKAAHWARGASKTWC